MQPVAQILVQPRNIDPYRTLVDTPGATCAKLGESRIFQLPDASFPRPADASGIGFTAECVAADRLKVCAGIQAGAAAYAVKRFAKDRVLAHPQSAVIDQHKVEFARPARFA